MRKEREQFFKNITIDDLAMARMIVEETTENIAKADQGIKVGAVAMVLLFLSGFIPHGNTVIEIIRAIIGIGYFVALIMSYFCGGGIKTAFSIGWKIAKVVWFIVPYFLFDLAAAFVAGALVVMGYFYVPILFIWLYRRQEEKDLAIAQQYVAQAENVYN